MSSASSHTECAAVGIAFLLTFLISEMFHLIGIDLIRDLLKDAGVNVEDTPKGPRWDV